MIVKKCAVCIIIILVLFLALAFSSFSGKNTFDISEKPTKEQIADFLYYHNKYRAEVGVPDLLWSDELADAAALWANALKDDDCGFYHSENPYGENLWRGTIGFFSVEDVVTSWGSEKKDYNYRTNACRGVCGHYTQMVWKSTTLWAVPPWNATAW